MADDDIERLLAEIDKTTSSVPAPTSGVPAKREPAASPDAKASSGGRVAFAGISAVVFGGAGFVVGIFTPFILSGPSVGVGAAAGAFVTGLIAGPPRWFSS